MTAFNGNYKAAINEKIWLACGVVTGETNDEIEGLIDQLTIENRREQFLLKYATQVTNDSVWKKNLNDKIGDVSKNVNYSLYKNQISSLPYLVETYDERAKLLYDSIVKGVEGFIIELPIITEYEFKKFRTCLDYLATRLNG